MKITVFPLGQLKTNCYLIYDENLKEGVIIDPGDEAEFIAGKIKEMRIKLKAVIATHGHFDHVLAAGELQLILSEIRNGKTKKENIKLLKNFIPFYIHWEDLFLIKTMNQSASYWFAYPVKKPLPVNIVPLKDQIFLRFKRFYLEILKTPGHTPGSISLLLRSKNDSVNNSLILFSGDTLFKGGYGRYDFSYSSKSKLKKSLKKIINLPQETLVYPGHGEKTTIREEKFIIFNF